MDRLNFFARIESIASSNEVASDTVITKRKIVLSCALEEYEISKIYPFAAQMLNDYPTMPVDKIDFGMIAGVFKVQIKPTDDTSIINLDTCRFQKLTLEPSNGIMKYTLTFMSYGEVLANLAGAHKTTVTVNLSLSENNQEGLGV